MTRGIDKAQKKSYMIASVQNLKRLVGDIKRKTKKAVKMMEDISEKIFSLNNFQHYLLNPAQN